MLNKKLLHRHIITLLALGCLSTGAFAENIELQKNHPDQYTVKKGDTLWGISGKFLKDPWKWPNIWKMNRADIKNPHWIYPGDVVVLDTSSGDPQLKLLRETVTLEPGVREEPLNQEAVQAISPKVITPFLSQPLLIENGGLDNAPRIISGQDNRLVLSEGTRVYVNEIKEGQGIHWNVYRPDEPFIDPDTQEVLGTEATYLGDVNIARYGAPATADVVRSKEEIFTKDRLVQAPDEINTNFIPHAPDSYIKGRVLRVYSGLAEAGPDTVISISRGKADGLEPGNVLAIYRYGKIIRDPEYKRNDNKVTEEKPKLKELNYEVKTREDGIKEVNLRKSKPNTELQLEPNEVKLPDERIGLLMIFRTFNRVSYGLIMNESEPIHTLDVVRTP